MELLTITLTAGESKRFEKPGRYFEIIDSAAAVRVDFYSVSGQQTDQMQNALSGLFLECNYGSFVITSATAQTVSFLLLENGRGGSRRQPGNVVIVDTIPSGVTSYSAGPDVAISAATVVQLIAPAAGVSQTLRGINGYLQSGAGGAILLRVFAAPTAPTIYSTTGNVMILADEISSGGVLVKFGNSDLKKKLPIGWGVWVVCAVISVAASQINVSCSSSVG